ncbi:MAG: ATP-NAD kinase family protein [Candidatus Freyarchaeota archaeon]|nr:ATP-NAD kinase family protein [Candidatus Freyrarchaeum guaymaensis]HDO81244.1 ATP-NAD kinase [Candidatus Bathyarchaeota archaeon]
MSLKLLGFLVNPIAGIGGKYGFKGSDDPELVKVALKRGAKLVSLERAERALNVLSSVGSAICLVCPPGIMGAAIAEKHGFHTHVLSLNISEPTTPQDTINAARLMVEMDVPLILYAGGDGTTVDLLKAVDKEVPILGIPSGVKIWSATFATSPESAGHLAIRFLWEELSVREAEVLDVDEDAFRQGKLLVKLKGYALTPYEPTLLQGAKVMSPTVQDERDDQYAIAKYVKELLEPDVIYILGPGSTCKAVADVLGVEKTVLGVDLIENGRVIAKDVDEEEILRKISGRPAKIIISPIGRQGYIFGRGNQQISSEVIKRVGLENIIIVATPYKLSTLPSLRVDTGDPELDNQMKGRYFKIITGYHQEAVKKIK